ncbi:glycosyltransferase [Vibrio sp. 10N]|uniref:glycosyltransferase n=1 Tax=Vibrio sp. 10N TaxID=3058938 RepID=UPI002813D338|nr:glycosyltransferase family 4 protein [Vibrio sp. 10N]
MKTLGYVLSDFPVLSETFVGTEIRAMEALGYQVKPFAFNINYEGGQPVDKPLLDKAVALSTVNNLRAIAIWLRNPLRSVKALSFILRQNGLPKKSLIRSAGQLAQITLAHKCDHLHAHFALHTAATAIAASKLSGCQVSFVGHGYDVYARPADLALKLESSDFSVCVCEDMCDQFLELAPNHRVHIVECGIELSRYPFHPRRQHNGRLLFVGRLTEKKGLVDLLQAIALLPDDERPMLDLVGDGEQKSLLIALAIQLGIHNQVHFLGSRPSEWIIDNAAHYLALCTPFCEARDGDRDTGPVVVKEAMALGLPVICSNFMGCKEMIVNGTGLLVPPNDPQSLAAAIVSTYSMSTQQRMAQLEKARTRVTRLYSARTSAKKLATAIEGSYCFEEATL